MRKNKILLLAILFIFVFIMTACINKNSIEDDSEIKNNQFTGDKEKIDKSKQEKTIKLTVLTNRKNIINDVLNIYGSRFSKENPNITINFKFIEDYERNVARVIRLEGASWGDICMIPDSVQSEELRDYFTPFGTVDEMKEKYDYIGTRSRDGIVYGIPSAANVQGILYNKKVWREAGITENPKNEVEFLNDLKKIKEKTDAIPLFTNYTSPWILDSWEENCYGTATGSASYKNILSVMKDPFTKGKSHYRVYKILYDAVNLGLTEGSPQNGSWETCCRKLSIGRVGCTVVSSSAIKEAKEFAKVPDEIGFMPFPLMVDKVQFASVGMDYSFGINKKSSHEEIVAAKKFVKWMTEESDYYIYQGGISIINTREYSNNLKEFQKNNIKLIANATESVAKEKMLEEVCRKSEIYLEKPNLARRVIDSANSGKESFDDIMKDVNDRWSEGQK